MINIKQRVIIDPCSDTAKNRPAVASSCRCQNAVCGGASGGGKLKMHRLRDKTVKFHEKKESESLVARRYRREVPVFHGKFLRVKGQVQVLQVKGHVQLLQLKLLLQFSFF